MQRRRPMLPMTRALLVIAFTWGLLASQLAEAGVPSCRGSVPKAMLAAVEGSQGKWRMIEIGQLSKDDQKLWSKLNHGRCPGYAVGDFDLSGRQQFAVLLRASASLNTRLVHAVEIAEGKYLARILYEGESANSPVVFAGKPGKYTSSEDREGKIVLSAPPVILAVLESGATAYYFSGNEVRSLLISE